MVGGMPFVSSILPLKVLTTRQANVMLAYPIPEAEELLRSKLATAKTSLANCEEDMDFLREQITVWLTSSTGAGI